MRALCSRPHTPSRAAWRASAIVPASSDRSPAAAPGSLRSCCLQLLERRIEIAAARSARRIAASLRTAPATWSRTLKYDRATLLIHSDVCDDESHHLNLLGEHDEELNAYLVSDRDRARIA